MCNSAGALLHDHATADEVWVGAGGYAEGEPGENRGMTNVPATRHNTAQDNGLVQPWEGMDLSQSSLWTRSRAVVFLIRSPICVTSATMRS